ncbi:MAG: hypothetical protein JO264_19305 [Acidisphaera sp.]|nr:hypothetical protein [Acidisphaera sp.]
MPKPDRWKHSRLAGDRRGVVAILFALLLLPLIGLIGLAVDYGFKTRAQTEIDVAADSATLVASTTAANAFSTGASNWKTRGQTAGANFFNAQIADLGYVSVATTTITVSQDPNSANVFNASLTFSGTIKTFFARVFGYSTFTVTGGSAATTTASTYIDIHILMDNSSSMLIGSSQQDMANLAAYIRQPPYVNWDSFYQSGTYPGNPQPGEAQVTPAQAASQPCAFGCHFSNTYASLPKADGSGYITVPEDFYGVAQLTGVQLRLNVVTAAVANVISSVQAKQPQGTTLYQVALYALNNPSRNNQSGSVSSPMTIYPLGANFTAAKSAAANLQVPLTYDNSYEPDTDLGGAISYVNGIIPASTGDGSAANHKEYLFLITDGVMDYLDSGGNRHMGALDPTLCTPLKNRNVQIYVLYTTYVPIPTNGFYSSNIAPFASNGPPTTLASNLQSCASAPSAYFNATSTSDINTQMQNMLNAALGSAGRFTQ